MKESQNHKILLKTTSLFGLVEVIRMLLKILTNKFASIFLGVSGVGLIGLIENTAQLIQSATSFGIHFTGVREIAVHQNHEEQLQKKIKLIRRFSWFGGVSAGLISIVFAVQLSQLTFDTTKYAIWFVLLAVYFVANSVIQSRTILLEGLQSIRKLLVLSSISSVSNSLIVVAAYYFFHLEGIVMAMILTSVVNLILYLWVTRKLLSMSTNLSKKECKQGFLSLLKSGSFLAANTFFGLLCFFIIRLYLKNASAHDEYLGYFQVSNVFINAYLGMIFIAMSKFFYPKLSQLSDQVADRTKFVNDQLEINFMIILPAILFVYVFGHELIALLFSSGFAPVYQILVFGLLSVLIKGFNYSVGYLILSQNNIKRYFYINLISDFFNLAFTIFLFHHFQLYGIGLALVLNYLLSAIYMFWFAKKTYDFRLNLNNKKAIVWSSLLAVFITVTYFYMDDFVFRMLILAVFVAVSIKSILQLDTYVFNHAIHRFFKIKYEK